MKYHIFNIILNPLNFSNVKSFAAFPKNYFFVNFSNYNRFSSVKSLYNILQNYFGFNSYFIFTKNIHSNFDLDVIKMSPIKRCFFFQALNFDQTIIMFKVVESFKPLAPAFFFTSTKFLRGTFFFEFSVENKILETLSTEGFSNFFYVQTAFKNMEHFDLNAFFRINYPLYSFTQTLNLFFFRFIIFFLNFKKFLFFSDKKFLNLF